MKVAKAQPARGESYQDPLPPERGIKIGATVAVSTWQWFKRQQAADPKLSYGVLIDQLVALHEQGRGRQK